MNNNAVSWITRIFSLLPLIAAGANAIGKDKDNKTALAKDALALSIAGAKIEAPDVDQSLVDTIGGAAHTVLEATVTQMHNASQPAPQAA